MHLSRRQSWIVLSVVLVLVVGANAGHGAQGPEQQLAAKILAATGVKGGIVVHLGCGDGKLTAALRADQRFLVHGLDADTGNVEKARQYLQKLGVYGGVSIEQWTGNRLPYADSLVNLVVSEDLGGVSRDEVMRVLCPGGVAYIKHGKEWEKAVKPWPAEMDQWTHFRHGADGNMVSKDQLVGPPRHMQWVAGPLWQRSHTTVPSITSLVSSAGRMFYIADEAPSGVVGMPDQWCLIARDAFNGVPLWKIPIKDWGSAAWSYWTEGHSARFNHPIHVRERLVADGDRVYVTLGFNAPVSALDTATGKKVMTYDGTQYTDQFVCRDGVLYLSVNDRPQKPWPGKGVLPQPTKKDLSKKTVKAIDAATGKVLWKSGPFTGKQAKPDRMGSMQHLSLIACEKGVYLVDDKDVVCLDLKTGKDRWRTERLALPAEQEDPRHAGDLGNLYHGLNRVDMPNVVYYEGVLFVLNSKGHSGFKWESPSILQALDPDTGKEMWRYAASPINYLDVPDALGAQGLVWLPEKKDQMLIGLDPATGKEERKFSLKKALNVGHHHRCYPNRASERYLIAGRRGAEFVDLKTGKITLHHWMRSGCRYGHMLANGMIYRTPDYCQCYMSFQPRGFYAMVSEEAARDFQDCLAKENVLEKGPAFGKGRNPKPEIRSRDDWPTFRHDPMRSGATPSAIPTELKTLWAADLSGKITPPVIAHGKVFVATVDSHTVHAFDAGDGKPLWSYTTGGRVDSPPTIHQGTAIFGSADGWVYCVRVDDGVLAWRFRAAPGRRRVVAMDQLESTWPVHGSVLVLGDVVYFVAGRTSFLDGGVYAYAVDAKTGKLIERKQIHEVQTDTKTTGQLPQGALSDILHTNGESVYLRNRKIEFTTPIQSADAEPGQPMHLVADGGLLDSQLFHRAFWRLRAGRKSVVGNMIVFDDRQAYSAIAMSGRKTNQSFYVPAGARSDRIIGQGGVRGPSWLVGITIHQGGYSLAATNLETTKPAGKSKPDKRGKHNKRAERGPAAWTLKKFPINPWAMVAAGKALFVAGFPDRIDPKDPWATFEGRRGGVLCALSTKDGKKLSEQKLDSPPVWNGMAAADRRLYISTRDGRVLCMGKDQ